MIKCVGSGAVIENVAPEPLNKEPPSDPVHVIRGTITSVQNLTGVGSTAASAVNALTEIGDLDGERGVLTGIPSIGQRVGCDLRHLVPNHAYHAVHPNVAVWGLEGFQVRDVSGHGKGISTLPGAELSRVTHPGVRKSIPNQRRKREVVEPTHRSAEILNVHVISSQQQIQPAPRVDRQGPGFRCDGAFYHGLNGQSGQRFPVRVKPVVFLFTESNRF